MAATQRNETASDPLLAASIVRPAAFFIAAFVVLGAGNCLLHASVLRLPYFWDEAGYFVPTARDLLLSGDPIPQSVRSNAHPPLVTAWLAAAWRVFGFAPVVTRIAMLIVSSLGLIGAYRLGSILGDRITGVASALCLGLYPVYFAQGSLAQLDLPAAAMTMWGLADYQGGNIKRGAVAFTLAGLAKETAVIAPLALLGLEAVEFFIHSRNRRRPTRPAHIAWVLLCPLVVLALWFAYHYWRTGAIFGNAQYFRYNVIGTLSPRRAAAAFLLQVWYAFGHMNLFALTVPALCVWFFRRSKRLLRQRPGPLVGICLAYVVTLSWIGGAALARYMLPATSIVIILSIAILRAGIGNRWSFTPIAVAAAAFAITLSAYPPYHFALDDNLAYRGFVELQASGARFLQESANSEPVLTAWPASDEFSQPYLGYTGRPLKTLSVSDFEPAALAQVTVKNSFQTAFVFSRAYEPPNGMFRPGRYLRALPFWIRAQREFFTHRPSLSPEAAATLLGGEIVWYETRGPLYAAVIEKEASRAHRPQAFPPVGILAVGRAAGIESSRRFQACSERAKRSPDFSTASGRPWLRPRPNWRSASKPSPKARASLIRACSTSWKRRSSPRTLGCGRPLKSYRA